MIDYFLMIRGTELLGASLIFIIRISIFFFLANNYLTNFDQHQSITTNNPSTTTNNLPCLYGP